MDDVIQSAWLGKMQTELGVLSTNLMLRDIQLEVAEAKVVQLTAQVEAYRERVREVVKANDELKVTIKADRKAMAELTRLTVDRFGIDAVLEVPSED